jgi:serine/threonine protein phosphatase 1
VVPPATASSAYDNPDRQEVFGTLACADRVWAVAAVHGEADRLRQVHDQLEARFAHGDRLVYLGNYLGHGERIGATLDELIDFRRHLLCRPGMEPGDIVYLRGAQEEMWRKLLQLQFAPNPVEVLDWMLSHGVGATLAAYGGGAEDLRSRIRQGALALTKCTSTLRQTMQGHPGHDDLMNALRRYAVTSDGALLFVHAGVDPSRPLSEQRDALWWGGGDLARLDAPFAGFRLVVRGYDRNRREPRMGPYGASLDAGCGFGGVLVAGCFNLNGELVDRIEA